MQMVYVVIRDFLLDYDWSCEIIGIYDNAEKAKNKQIMANARIKHEWEQEHKEQPYQDEWTDEYYRIETFVLNKPKY